jgi:hypothetical protein
MPLKSLGSNPVRVRVPPRALCSATTYISFLACLVRALHSIVPPLCPLEPTIPLLNAFS